MYVRLRHLTPLRNRWFPGRGPHVEFSERRCPTRGNTRTVINRADPVLALLPDDEDLPRAFAHLSAAEQVWRGRLFAIYWLMDRNEAYAWAIALSSDVPDDARTAVEAVSDEQIVDDLVLVPLPR